MENDNQKTIFIVEDNEMFAETLKASLQLQGYAVEIFRTGESMISSWEEDPDIILLDYYIESPLGVAMNGEQILRFIRKINKSLPVVMLTSSTDIAQATRLLKSGAVDFIVKDEYLPDNLKRTISQILETVSLRRELSQTRGQVKRYRQRFFIIALLVIVAAVALIWFYS